MLNKRLRSLRLSCMVQGRGGAGLQFNIMRALVWGTLHEYIGQGCRPSPRPVRALIVPDVTNESK